jgi:hypothetical protein
VPAVDDQRVKAEIRPHKVDMVQNRDVKSQWASPVYHSYNPSRLHRMSPLDSLEMTVRSYNSIVLECGPDVSAVHTFSPDERPYVDLLTGKLSRRR